MTVFDINWASVDFEWPWLLLLLPLPWLLNFRKQSINEYSATPQTPIFQAAKNLGIGGAASSHKTAMWKLILLSIAWLLLVIASTRPTYIGEQIDIPLSGRDLMLAVDISPSMKEKDMHLEGMQRTRLEVVKKVVSDFVDVRAGDRVGLILFGSEPYIQAPLTFDVTTVNTLLQESFLGMAGQATAIGDAIALGVKRLRQRPEQSRVLVLLTDGANTAGEIPPEKAAQLAEKEKIKIYTIGIGADEMTRRSFFGTRKVNPSADLDETMLISIADITGGQYFRARNTPELEMIYESINLLEPVEQETRSYRPTKALFYWFLGLSLLCYLPVFLTKVLQGMGLSLQQSKQGDVG